MLVLSRKVNETIVIDGRITLEVLQVQGDRIRVGIQAPAEVKILRGELMPFAADDRDASRTARTPPRRAGVAELADRVGEGESIRYRHHAQRDAALAEIGAA